MRQELMFVVTAWACVTALLPAIAADSEAVPYPVALDAAAVVEDRIDDIGKRALVLGNAGLTAEFLLQSVGDILRVFPAWPKDKDAAFTDLRAQGGFLVSAEQSAGRVTRLEITSTVGGKLRVLNPWTGALDERETKPTERIEIKP